MKIMVLTKKQLTKMVESYKDDQKRHLSNENIEHDCLFGSVSFIFEIEIKLLEEIKVKYYDNQKISKITKLKGKKTRLLKKINSLNVKIDKILYWNDEKSKLEKEYDVLDLELERINKKLLDLNNPLVCDNCGCKEEKESYLWKCEECNGLVCCNCIIIDTRNMCNDCKKIKKGK